MLGTLIKKIFGCGCGCDSAEETKPETGSNACAASQEKPKQEAKKETKSTDTVEIVLVKSLMNRILVVKALKEIGSVDSKEAEKMLDSLPVTIKKAVKKEEAEKIQQQLEYLGADVELK